jgi:hypothetical protein
MRIHRRNVLRCSAVVLLLLLATSAGFAQKKSTAWIRGTWEGTGYQTDDKSTWAMLFTARGIHFSIDYPSLKCGGRWKLISTGASGARFREILVRGQDKCADRGSVVIQRLNRKQILFLYSYRGARDISASAVLSRRPSKSSLAN